MTPNQTEQLLPVDEMLARMDSVSPLHNLMMLGHVENKLEKNSEHLEWYRRKGLGMPEKSGSKADEMKILSTGPVHVNQSADKPQSSGLKTALTAGLAVATLLGVPAAGAIGWLLNRPDPAPIIVPPDTDTRTDVGLGKFKDLIPAAK